MAYHLAAPEPDLAAAEPRRTAGTVVRYLLGVMLGIVVLVVLLGKRGELAAARHQLGHLQLGWLAASVLAEGASLAAFGLLQHRVLTLAGTGMGLPGLLALSLANEAIANTVPGEPAVSSAYRYRYYRQRGASGASAGWTIFTVLVAQALGLSLLLLLGVLIALPASASAGIAAAAAAGLVVVVAAGAVLLRRDLVLRLIARLVRALRRVTGLPGAVTGQRIEAVLARMRKIPMSSSSAAAAVGLAAVVWALDCACLLCSFGAVHAAVPWPAVLLAYGVAQVAGSLPVVPGGLGVVEGSLAVILTGYGTARAAAVSAALAYRLVSFWLAIAAGWLSVGLIAVRARRRRQRDVTPGDR